MIKKEKMGMLSTFIGGVLWGINGTMASYLFMNKNITSNWLAPYRLMSAGLLMLIFLQYSGINLILLYSCLKEKRFPRKFELIALVLAILGIFILATHGNINALKVSPIALFWGLVSAFTLVIYSMSALSLIKKYGTALITAWGMLIGGAVLSPFAKPWNEAGIYDNTTFTLFLLIVLFGTILSFVLYLSGVAIIGPTKGSMISCIEPVAATLFSTVILSTPFKFLDAVGFFFILSTVFIVAYFDNK